MRNRKNGVNIFRKYYYKKVKRLKGYFWNLPPKRGGKLVNIVIYIIYYYIEFYIYLSLVKIPSPEREKVKVTF